MANPMTGMDKASLDMRDQMNMIATEDIEERTLPILTTTKT